MNTGGDAAEQVVRLSLEGFEVAAKLTGTAAKELTVLLVSVLKQEQKTKGKARLTNMLKSGKELKVFSVPNKDLKKFTEQAKKYGVLYCVLRDKYSKDDNAPVDIIARAEDASKIQRIFDRFELGNVDKGSIVANAEKSIAQREELANEVPTKSKGERIVEEAMGKPIQKDGASHENPTVAKTDKNPPSRQSSAEVDGKSDKGISKSAEEKPSVREKLERYKAQAKTEKEADRTDLDKAGEKTQSQTRTNQTTHQQPKQKKNRNKNKARESTMTNNFKPNKGGYRQPQLSPEEWKAKKQAEKDAVYQMIDDTATAIVQDGEKFRGFLDTQARLDRYSAANALLIYNQYPKATQLKDFGDWAEEKVSINKGAKSISILEPVEYTKADGTPGVSYNVKKVFDVSQTKGRQTPAPTVNRDPQALVAVMIDTSPVIVEVAPELPHPQMGAFYDNEKQTLFVKKDIGDSVALCQCVAQELGHAQLSIDSDSYSRKDMGFQAMCVGYMLCKKYGVDTKNFAINRIPEEWKNKEPKEIRAELSKTRTAMNEIHSRVSEEMYRQKQERSKGRDSR